MPVYLPTAQLPRLERAVVSSVGFLPEVPDLSRHPAPILPPRFLRGRGLTGEHYKLIRRATCACSRADNAVAAAEKEAHGKIEARKEQARAAAAKATEKVNQEIKSVGDTAVRNWTAVRTKVSADIDALKAGVARAKHDLDAKHAEGHAERLEWEAGVAIDYAIASVEQAKLAVLDAVSSRAEAERAKTS